VAESVVDIRVVRGAAVVEIEGVRLEGQQGAEFGISLLLDFGDLYRKGTGDGEQSQPFGDGSLFDGFLPLVFGVETFALGSSPLFYGFPSLVFGVEALAFGDGSLFYGSLALILRVEAFAFGAGSLFYGVLALAFGVEAFALCCGSLFDGVFSLLRRVLELPPGSDQLFFDLRFFSLGVHRESQEEEGEEEEAPQSYFQGKRHGRRGGL